MKMQFLAVAAAALMAAPTLHAQATAAPMPASPSAHMGRHGHGHGHGRMMKELGLSADQQSKVKAIHARYAPQMKSVHEGSKADFDAMRSARTRGDSAAMRASQAKLKADMAPAMQARQQEMAEVRGVLTPAQQQKFDVQAAKMKAHMGKRDRGGWAKRSAKRSADPAQAANPTK